MEKHFVVPVLLVSVVFSISMSGCSNSKDVRQPSPPTGKLLPGISTFTAIPGTIDAGQSAVLNWDTANAREIILKPDSIAVPISGSLTVKPAATTSYTIIASNETGMVQKEVTITVNTPSFHAPDLVVTDIFMQVQIIYYTIRNSGNAVSPPTTTYLYVDGKLPVSGSSSYVEALAPGIERTLSFPRYRWHYIPGVDDPDDDAMGAANSRMSLVPVRSAEGDYQDPSLDQHTITVCADAMDEAGEIDKKNNCMTKVWGFLFNRDLLTNGHFASWLNSSGKRPSSSTETSPDGA
jgi:hypothetical protein